MQTSIIFHDRAAECSRVVEASRIRPPPLLPTVTLGDVTGISLSDYMWDTKLDIGWVGGLANPTGVVLMIMLTIIVAFSHRIVRKSGHFEVCVSLDTNNLAFLLESFTFHFANNERCFSQESSCSVAVMVTLRTSTTLLPFRIMVLLPTCKDNVKFPSIFLLTLKALYCFPCFLVTLAFNLSW